MPKGMKRFTLDLDPAVQLRLKLAAANRGISMRKLCLSAIEKELSAPTPNGADTLSPHSLLHLTRLRDELFGGATLSGESSEIIRQSREARSKEI